MKFAAVFASDNPHLACSTGLCICATNPAAFRRQGASIIGKTFG
jgi:hypothetical protein